MTYDIEKAETREELAEMNRFNLLDALESSMRLTDDCATSSYLYLYFSLIDRGLAKTRASAISRALENNNMSALASGILQCDGSNFPLLVEIEPRLFHMLLSDGSNEGNHPVLIERLKEVIK
tara:strand:- start:31 stop:396 length:366 start_codon:yes stop_codon:yes gene_type:complete